MADTFDTFIALFSSAWIAANTSGRTPTFSKKHDYKDLDLANADYVLFYRPEDRAEKPDSFGHTHYDALEPLAIDIWTGYSDAHSTLMKLECKRIMNNYRFSVPNTGFHQISMPRERDFRDAMRGEYRWELDYELEAFHQEANT